MLCKICLKVINVAVAASQLTTSDTHNRIRAACRLIPNGLAAETCYQLSVVVLNALKDNDNLSENSCLTLKFCRRRHRRHNREYQKLSKAEKELIKLFWFCNWLCFWLLDLCICFETIKPYKNHNISSIQLNRFTFQKCCPQCKLSTEISKNPRTMVENQGHTRCSVCLRRRAFGPVRLAFGQPPRLPPYPPPPPQNPLPLRNFIAVVTSSLKTLPIPVSLSPDGTFHWAVFI